MTDPADTPQHNERGAPTLGEVADVAGVSRSTVSRVINQSPGVSERALHAVRRAIRETGYVPNEAARTLVTRRTNSIALVVSEHGDRVFDDPFFAGVMRGIHSGLAGSNRQLVLMLMAKEEDARQLENYLCGGHVDGALVVSLHGRDPLPQRLADAGLPVVVAGRPLSEERVPYVDADNFTGGLLAGRHLVQRGRTRLASIGGPEDMAAGIDRAVGWRRAMAEAEMDSHRIVHGDFTVEAGAAAMARLLDDDPDIDGVFAAADIVAIGALRELAARGYRVPEDVAVVGFDDSVLARSSSPPLTTVCQSVEELGRTLTWRLLAELAAESHLPPSVLLPTELITREST